MDAQVSLHNVKSCMVGKINLFHRGGNMALPFFSRHIEFRTADGGVLDVVIYGDTAFDVAMPSDDTGDLMELDQAAKDGFVR